MEGRLEGSTCAPTTRPSDPMSRDPRTNPSNTGYLSLRFHNKEEETTLTYEEKIKRERT